MANTLAKQPGRSGPLAYQRVRSEILRFIETRKLSPGDRLPSERELAERFGLNHQTVRRGLVGLVQDEIIDRRVGVGTFLRTVPSEAATLPGRTGQTRSAKRKGTLLGCLIVAQRGNFAAELLGHLHHAAEERSIQLDIRTVSKLDDRAIQAVKEIAKDGCSSAILPAIPSPHPIAELLRLEEASPIPIIMPVKLPGLEKFCYEKPNVFGAADVIGTEMACRYFRSLGYGELAFLGPDRTSEVALYLRLAAYNRFTFRNGLANHVALVRPTSEDIDRAIRQWRDLSGNLGVICFDDDYAVRLLAGLHKHDLRIPEDVAVLGFNNIPLGATCDPPLSTIQFDYDYVVGAVLDHALAMGRGESAQVEGFARQTLVIRQSCGGRARMGEKLPDVVRQAEEVIDQMKKELGSEGPKL